MKLPNHTEVTHTSSPLGRMFLATADGKLVGAWFEAQAHLPDLQGYRHTPKHPVLQVK